MGVVVGVCRASCRNDYFECYSACLAAAPPFDLPSSTTDVITSWHQFWFVTTAAAPYVKKVGRAASCNCTADRCKFLLAEIMGAQNFNFASKMGDFQAKILHFLVVKFPTRRNFSTG